MIEHSNPQFGGDSKRRALLEKLLQKEKLSSTSTSIMPRSPAGSEAPLSFAQERLWFLDQMEPGGAHYNMSQCFRLKGCLNVTVLQECLNQIVRRHEALRTHFALVEDVPRQIIDPKATVELRLVDISTIPEVKREAEAMRLCTEEAQRPFDLAQGPLLRANLLRLGAEDHFLLLVLHHIASDGWSNHVLIRELNALYQALDKGRPSPLPDLPIQYADYAIWRRNWLQGEVLEKRITYWKKQLDGALTLLELPADRPRPAVQGTRGAMMYRELPLALAADLKKLSQAEGTTLFMTMLTAFQSLLHRYTGLEDIVVGSVIAGRSRAEVENLIGFFVNTLPFRSDLSGDPTFQTLLQRTREVTLEAYTQDVPFEKLVEALKPGRDVSHAPLFQVMFVFQNAPAETLQLTNLETTSIPIYNGTAKFDLTILVREIGESLNADIEYNTDLFDAATISRMLGHYQKLLEGIVAAPKQCIMDLSLLTEDERQQLLVEWNRPEQDFPRDKCVHQLFEEQAERTPDAVGVVFGNRRLSYRELNAKANQLAHHLLKLGVGPGTMVGICVERSLEMVIGLLGILKAGGAYVPMDPEYPKERLAFMMEDAQVPVLLTQAHLAASLPVSPARIVRLDADWPAIAAETPARVPSPVQVNNLAYMIYTSGSTGRPKGVLLEHRGLGNLVKAQIEEFQILPGDHVLQFASMSFDASVSEIFSALVIGATLCMAEFEKLLPGPELLKLLRDEEINVVTFPPTVLNAISEEDLPALRTVVSAGEACTLELAHRWGRNRRFINAYGPTEGTVCASMKVIAPAETKLTIGRAMANVQIYILDRHLQLLPVGVPGELHIGGVGLARGYHNRPELTAEKFIAHPFSADPTARLYKTGDLARFLPDGDIEYLGRLDHQVKIRGFRVELGEIEEVLKQHPEVRTSVVVAREDTPGDKRLTAYVVGRSGTARSSELRESLQGKLPDYMVPAAFVMLKSLPLTSSGKVDRKALPKPDFEDVVDKSKSAAPSTPTETALAKIWCEVLGLKQVGIHDDFFDLGGHSILAVKLVGKISKSLNYHISIPVFFRNPTIRKLATVIDQDNHVDHEAELTHNNGYEAPLITFQAKGDRPALFFLHGDWLGGGLYCGRLSKFLGEDQPFHVLPPYRSGKPTAVTMEEMAAYHIAAMQAHTPHGPYLLGGYCIGATIAMEMARQLLKKGEQVPHLLLVDPSPIGSQMLRDFWPIVDRVGQVMKWDLEKKIHYFDQYGVSFRRWSEKSPRGKFMAVCNRLGLAPRNGSSPVSEEPADGNIEILDSLDYAIYVLAYRLYNAKSVSVPITIYFPDETLPSRLAWVNDARKIFPKVTVEKVLGNHRSCIIEHTSALVDKMKETLDELSAVPA